MAASPVTASRRRMLEPIDPSVTIFRRPMSPRAETWVPPQSSIEFGPARSTRTVSPYLSPKKAMAPRASASSLVVSKWSQAAFARTSALTRSSISTTCPSVSPS
jgi:hypothetical protein